MWYSSIDWCILLQHFIQFFCSTKHFSFDEKLDNNFCLNVAEWWWNYWQRTNKRTNVFLWHFFIILYYDIHEILLFFRVGKLLLQINIVAFFKWKTISHFQSTNRVVEFLTFIILLLGVIEQYLHVFKSCKKLSFRFVYHKSP